MFFDRSCPNTLSSSESKSQADRPVRAETRRRNWAAIGLAAAMAAPVGLTRLSWVTGEQTPGNQPSDLIPGNKDLIDVGRQQFQKHQYEQAEKTLAAVKVANLGDKDREAYLSLLNDVKHAATERRAARQELANGEDAFKAQQSLDAIAHFKAVAANDFADDQSRRQAWGRLTALDAAPAVEAQPAQAVVAAAPPATQPASGQLTAKQRYDLGLAQYRNGDWADARENLQVAEAAGYKPSSIFQDPPAEILKRMDLRQEAQRERVQTLAQAAGPTTAPAQDNLAPLKATAEGEAARREQATGQAHDLVTQAQEAERSNNYDRALSLYTQASELDPSNQAAAQGRDHMLILMGRNPSATNLAEQQGKEIQARRGEITYQVQSNLDQAKASTQQGNFANAQNAIDRARLAAAIDPTIFTADQIRNFRTQIEQTELALRQAEERAKAASDNAIAEATRTRIAVERKQAIEDRQKTIADLIRTSQNLTAQGRYKEALQTVDQILILDPVNDYAVGVRPLLQDKNQLEEQRRFMEMRHFYTATQLNRAEEELVPYDDILRYPSDWPDISQTRDQTVAAEQRSGGAGDRATVAVLDRTLPEVAFDAVAFGDVIDFLRDVSTANLFVNWKSLEAAGIDRTTPVTARLHNVKFSKALNVILDSVGGGQTKLGYTIDEGVITISTQDDLSKNVVVRVYDIRDLIINVPDFTDAPQFSLDASQNQQGGGGGGGGGGAGGGGGGQIANQLFANANQQNQLNRDQGPSRQDLVDAITKLIEDTVATDTWKDNGGSVGAVRELEGQLIVTQTPENHRQLFNLLEQLRETRAIQITVETRFLTVQRNFLEDVGVDLNFLFNLNSSWSKKLGTIPLTTPDSTFVQNPQTGIQGSLGAQGSNAPVGLTTSATYLDDFQVQLVMRAVEASVTDTIVTAPRITLFNGQRAYVLVAIQRAFVSNLTPIVSTGVSSFAPTIGIVQSGVLLDVQATVSADRKYVTLTLRPQLATLLDLANFTFQTGASVAASTGVFGTAAVAAPSGTIQEPELQITEVKTTVSVPDGGTLLLGGQTLAGETEREIGVPVLSKIPFLKRAFTSRSMAKDEQILLILVRPTIIMQREIEQKQFPLLTSKLTNG